MNAAIAPAGLVNATHTEVRYAETDQMGYAHHGTAAVWFELGRTNWLRQIGYPYRRLEAEGLLMPVVRLSIRYCAPGRYEDQILIQSRLTEAGRVRVLFENRAFRVEGPPPGARVLLAEGQVELACVDRSGRPQRLSRELREVLARHLSAGPWPDEKRA
jgi:acyl-CoA thioester hydrolase